MKQQGLNGYIRLENPRPSRALYNDFLVGGGGAFLKKGPFCEIIYYRGVTVAEVNVHEEENFLKFEA